MNFDPISALVSKAADVATHYFPSEQDKAKFLAELQKEADDLQIQFSKFTN